MKSRPILSCRDRTGLSSLRVLLLLKHSGVPCEASSYQAPWLPAQPSFQLSFGEKHRLWPSEYCSYGKCRQGFLELHDWWSETASLWSSRQEKGKVGLKQRGKGSGWRLENILEGLRVSSKTLEVKLQNIWFFWSYFILRTNSMNEGHWVNGDTE